MYNVEKSKTMAGLLLTSVLLASAIGIAIDPLNVFQIVIALIPGLQGA